MGSFWRFRIKFGGFAISTPRTHTRRNPTKTHTSLVDDLPVGCRTFQQISCMGTEFSTARKSRLLGLLYVACFKPITQIKKVLHELPET